MGMQNNGDERTKTSVFRHKRKEIRAEIGAQHDITQQLHLLQ